MNVTVASKTSTTLLVTWLPPAIPNGVLTSYEVYYRGLSSVNPVLPSFYQALSVTLSTVSTSIELVNLVPYSDYTLSVRALTSGGPGEYNEQVEARTEEDGELLNASCFSCKSACYRILVKFNAHKFSLENCVEVFCGLGLPRESIRKCRHGMYESSLWKLRITRDHLYMAFTCIASSGR